MHQVTLNHFLNASLTVKADKTSTCKVTLFHMAEWLKIKITNLQNKKYLWNYHPLSGVIPH